MVEVDPGLQNDARWQLIERINASSSFQKSARLRDLLSYMAERTLRGKPQDLSEQRIGRAVFGKREDYSVVEDSSVRVHVRQLRLKLHEYFDGEGRGETFIVGIPKGAYTAVFRAVEQNSPASLAEAGTTRRLSSWSRLLPWALSAVFLITTLAAWFRHPGVQTFRSPIWPLGALFDQGNRSVRVVVADANYGMRRQVNESPVTLDEYLSPSYWSDDSFSNPHLTDREQRMLKSLSHSLLTSYADLVAVNSLVVLSGDSRDRMTIVSARNLHPRDLQEGSFVFVGSPSSNPWVFHFENRLNFVEHEGTIGESPKCFQNLHPQAGELESYCTFSGSSGEDYATISLLPLSEGNGRVLILQGLQQEGTEAAALFLADAGNRQRLQQALGISGSAKQPVYFEALLRTQTIESAPASTFLVATRLLHP